MIQIKLISEVENSVFAQYKGIYLNEEQAEVSHGAQEAGKTIKTKVSQGDIVLVDIEPVKTRWLQKIPLNFTIHCDAIATIPAKDVNNGVCFTITWIRWLGFIK